MSQSQREIAKMCSSREHARNEALKWLELRGGAWGGSYEPKIGRREVAGSEVGVTTTDQTHRVIREDWQEPVAGKTYSGPHFNVSAGKGGEKAAFYYPLSADAVQARKSFGRMIARQRPRNELR